MRSFRSLVACAALCVLVGCTVTSSPSAHVDTQARKLVIVFASRAGQTEKIARFIAARIEEKAPRVLVVLHELGYRLGIDEDLDAFDGAIIGGAVYGGFHSSRLERFASKTRRPSAFFSVSMSAAAENQTTREGAALYVARFLNRSKLEPVNTATFAGALSYRAYPWPVGPFVRLVARIARWPDLDKTRNYEYTKWDEVAAFADATLHIMLSKWCEEARCGSGGAEECPEECAENAQPEPPLLLAPGVLRSNSAAPVGARRKSGPAQSTRSAHMRGEHQPPAQGLLLDP